MNRTTLAGDPATDLQHDPRGKHGDVDINGDLVNELDARLTRCITATSPGLAEDQLRAVRVMLTRRATA